MDVFLSNSLSELLGVDADVEPSLDEVLGVYYEEDRSIVESAVEDALNNGEPFDTEVRFERPDGEVRWLRVQGTPTVKNDEVVTLRGAVQDITDHRRIEAELRQERNLLEGVVETSPIGIIVVDADGTFTFVNERAEEIYGRSRETISEFTHDDPRWDLIDENGESFDDGDAPFDQVVSGKESMHDRTLGLLRPSGDRVWVSVNGASQWDDDGNLQRAIFAFEDITEQRELETRVAEILGRVTDAFYALDDDFRFTHVNDRAEELLQASEEELLGENLWEQFPAAADVDEVWDAFHTAMETQGPQSYELYFEPLNFRVEATVYPSQTGVSVYFRDVTELNQQIEEIRRLKERLELAVEGANLGVWDWDMQTDEVEFNDQWAEMLGYTLTELESHLRTWENRVHPDDLDDVKDALEAHTLQKTEYYDTEHRMRTADGEWKWIRDIGKIVDRNEDGEPLRAVGIHLDIDEFKQHQQELKRKTEEFEELTNRLETQYQALFEEAPVMAVITRIENDGPIIEDCNDQFAETLELTKEALIGTKLAELYTPESRDTLIDGGGYKRSLEGEFTKESRMLLTSDGEVVETLLRAIPQRDTSGEVVGTLAMYVDITEREEVKRANKRLEEFASIVSHDLRNPLNVATGHLELAREDCESPHLEGVEQAHDRMNTLIEDLLTLARQGKTVTETEAVDLTAVVEDCWKTVATAEASLNIEGNRRWIVANKSRLKQLLENLIRNAVEHGGSDVTVTAGGLGDGFYIEDDGPGIPKDDIESVFEAGYSTNAEGTGFGLSIVQRIVEAHEWNIRATRGAEGGARFEITDVAFANE